MLKKRKTFYQISSAIRNWVVNMKIEIKNKIKWISREIVQEKGDLFLHPRQLQGISAFYID